MSLSILFFSQKSSKVSNCRILCLAADTTVGGGAVVKYDHVVSNWGGVYQLATGIFTAPYYELYSFSCSLMSHPGNYVYLSMVKNGKKKNIHFSVLCHFNLSTIFTNCLSCPK